MDKIEKLFDMVEGAVPMTRGTGDRPDMLNSTIKTEIGEALLEARMELEKIRKQLEDPDVR